jgi:hypothetical protein
VEWLLGFLLLICGFAIGWRANPIVFEFIMNLDCHCDSGRLFGECCYLKDE